jgi:hypothetical protein
VPKERSQRCSGGLLMAAWIFRKAVTAIRSGAFPGKSP